MICKTCNTMNSNDAEMCVKCNSKLSNSKKVKPAKFIPKKKKKQIFKTPKKNKIFVPGNLKNKFNKDTVILSTLIVILIIVVAALNFDLISFNKEKLDDYFNKYSEIVITADIPIISDINKKELVKKDSSKNGQSIQKKKTKNVDKNYVNRTKRKMEYYVSKKDSMKMILIPASEEISFGSDEVGLNEKPVHKRSVNSYYIDEHEVTNLQYRIFIEQTGHPLPKFFTDPRFNGLNQPVVGISYKDASSYARWAGKRLPTEYEWEKAARGGIKKAKYPYSNTMSPKQACYDLNPELNGPSDVKKYDSNDFDLYDMSGNVYEWTSSLAAPYPGGELSNEYDANNYRILRGGSWKSIKKDLNVSKRNIKGLLWKNNDVGFRCAMDN